MDFHFVRWANVLTMPTNIMILRGGGLGDTLLALQAVHAVRRHFQPCTIEWAGNPAYLPILRLAINQCRTRSADGREFAVLRSETSTPEDIRGSFSRDTPYDLLVAWTPGDETFERNLGTLAKRFIRAEPHPPAQEPPLHTSDYLLATLLPFGVNASNQLPVDMSAVQLTAEHLQQARQELLGLGVSPGKKYYLLHPGSGGVQKCWPISSFIELAHHLSYEGEVIWSIGPADSKIHDELQRRGNGTSRNLLDSPPLPIFAAILRQSAGYVGNDSGVTHLAAACGTSTVALFGPTNPAVWGPRGREVVTLRRNAGCQACAKGSASGHICLPKIGVQEVLEALLDFRI